MAATGDRSGPIAAGRLDSTNIDRTVLGTGAVPDPKNRPRRSTLVVTRVTFFALILTVTLLNIIKPSSQPGSASAVLVENWPLLLGSAVVLAAAFLAIDLLTPRKKIATLVGIVIGLIAGLVVTVAFSFVIDLVARAWDFDSDQTITGVVKVLLGIAFAYLGVTTVLQTKDDIRLVIPYVEFAKQIRGVQPMALDTSALIDGRVLELSETGLIQAPCVVPQFVIDELQALGDSADKVKRERGRRGLDMVSKLRRMARGAMSIDAAARAEDYVGAGVDQMLIEYARIKSAVIITTDSGLAKTAEIASVEAINLHDVANALRPSAVPGEPLRVSVVRRGEQAGQGVAYLADGTMVVIDNGERRIGQEVELVVTSSLRTANGRMIFGRVDGDDAPEPEHAVSTAAGDELQNATGRELDDTNGGAVADDGGRQVTTPSHDRTARPRKPGKPNRARNPRR
ncbi:MAG: TRAM domain-containing protein [Planctomycetota bacterium]